MQVVGGMDFFDGIAPVSEFCCLWACQWVNKLSHTFPDFKYSLALHLKYHEKYTEIRNLIFVITVIFWFSTSEGRQTVHLQDRTLGGGGGVGFTFIRRCFSFIGSYSNLVFCKVSEDFIPFTVNLFWIFSYDPDCCAVDHNPLFEGCFRHTAASLANCLIANPGDVNHFQKAQDINACFDDLCAGEYKLYCSYLLSRFQ